MNLPEIQLDRLNLNQDWIELASAAPLSSQVHASLEANLKSLKPWRKGPFSVFGIKVDSEWASYLKWNRLKSILPALEGKRVLDIGASSGYYMFRMLHYKPSFVLGVDPSYKFIKQFQFLQHYIQAPNVDYLQMGFEKLEQRDFDFVFSMGILYHCKGALEALSQKRDFLKPNGMLILEGLYWEGQTEKVFIPEGRYAQMKNVYSIPTIACLEKWLHESGFGELRVLSKGKTSFAEQRKTEWIDGYSLDKFLDTKDSNKTIEGHLAPRRFLLSAKRR